MVFNILVGGYSYSVSTLAFDPDATPPSLKLASKTEVGRHPSWLARHPTHKNIVFATIEQSDGQIAIISVDSDGKSTLVETVSSGGADPAHAIATEGKLWVGNYSGSSVFIYNFSPDKPYLSTDKLPEYHWEGTGPRADRQEKSHPHQVYLHPTRSEYLVPDLGADKTWRLVESGGTITEGTPIDFEPGHGPRHCIVVDDILYTVAELSLHLVVHRLPALPEPPVYLSTVPTLPYAPAEGMLAAEILHAKESPISPSLLYITNRNDPSPEGDLVTIFTPITEDSPEPKRVGQFRTGLQHIRGMEFGGENDKYLVIGGAQGGGIKVYERLQGGLEFKELAVLTGDDAGKPTGFLWL